MLLIVLLQDQEGVVHNETEIELEYETTLGQLKESISLKLNIAPKWQELSFADGRRIRGIPSYSKLSENGLLHMDTLIVKHFLLHLWSAVLQSEERFKETDFENLNNSIRRNAEVHIDILVQKQFFLNYPTLDKRRLEIEKLFSTNFNRKLEAVKNSCRVHFKKVYGENVQVTFEERGNGSRTGCLCILDNESTISKFYVKTQHAAGDELSSRQYNVDLRELFVYKFLEQLKMGPEIHFLDNESSSDEWKIYIGSREVPGFKTLQFLELNQPQTAKEYSEEFVQILFVFSTLMLGDYHTENMGFDNAFNPFIVDFTIAGRKLSSVTDLHEGVRRSEYFNKATGSIYERLELSLNFFKKSNFSDVFETSYDSFMQNQKSIIDKSLLVYEKPQKLDDLKEYVEKVRKNIKLYSDYSTDK